jgi:uncharacterized membrane protein
VSESSQLIICTFDAADKAAEVEEALDAIDKQIDTFKLGNIAIIRKTTDGAVEYHETRDRMRTVSQTVGAVAGTVAWFVHSLAGSFGAMAGENVSETTYAAVRGRLRDSGFPDNALEQLGEHLDAGMSALITLVKPEEAPYVMAEIEKLGGHLQEQTLEPDLVAELRHADQ